MEIENPKTAEFVPLLGAFNFEYKPLGSLRLPDEFSFRIDWTKGGEGQDVLREHMQSKSLLRVRNHGGEYRGAFKDGGWGINTSDDMVIVEVRW